MEKTENNYTKVQELRKLHQPVFEALGVKGALFFPKMFYKPQGKEELYVSFFKSELQRGQDLFTEMVNREFVSEDQSRTLYRWKYNPQWAEDYEATESTPARYLIPVSELEKDVVWKELDKYPAPKVHGEEPLQDCTGDDCSIDMITIRDLYAIVQNKPVSHKKWLSELIGSNQPRTKSWPG